MSASEPTLNQVYDEYAHVGNFKRIFYDWDGLNEKIFFAANGIHGEGYDRIMQLASKIGDHDLFFYYFAGLTMLALFIVLLRKVGKHGGVKAHLTSWIAVLSVLFVAYFASGVTTQMIKQEMAYKRPYYQYGIQKVVLLERLPPEKAIESFPSGHATFSATMATALWPVMPPFLRWVAVFTVMIISWSRLAVGVHFPADILAGLCIGFFVTLLMRAIIYGFYRKFLKWNC